MIRSMKKFLPIQTISAATFRPYGRVIHYPQKNKKSPHHNLFRIVLSDPAAPGWRIAYLIVRDRCIGRLEQHPGSHESFEPISGHSLLFVAGHRRPDAIRCFRLDRPVIVTKGIWHGIVTLGRESEVKLTENARVTCAYWRLEAKLLRKDFSARKKA